MHEIRTVAVIGAGTMGHSLAQVFAQRGYRVWLNDVQEEALSRAQSLIAANLGREIRDRPRFPRWISSHR